MVRKLEAAVLRRLAVLGSCSPETIQKVYQGKPVRGLAFYRALAALHDSGIEPQTPKAALFVGRSVRGSGRGQRTSRNLDRTVVRVVSERAMTAPLAPLGNHQVGGDRPESSQRAAVCFCLCGSAHCDVIGWANSRTARFRCSDCGSEATVEGFTIGRTFLHPSLLKEAKQDAAGPRPESPRRRAHG